MVILAEIDSRVAQEQLAGQLYVDATPARTPGGRRLGADLVSCITASNRIQSSGYGEAAVELVLDLGDADDQGWLEDHLAERGLSIEDVIAAVSYLVPRRKGNRLYGYGRGLGGRPIVVVFSAGSGGWRPRTAWQMDDVEDRWWRRHGGR